MSEYEIEFGEDWDRCFSRLDKSMQRRVAKKILQLQREIPARHLGQGVQFHVSEIGQYRLLYKIDEKRKVKTIYFVGKHKEYENWLGI
ncbi:Uncharacterised protein [Candidatus Gugararchaeum adminiculabundum]|nr:Uncharacterised protein [Candidatus Gugararchaeum adminiculabundum]